MFTKSELEKFLKSSLKACLHVDVHMMYTESLGMATETFITGLLKVVSKPLAKTATEAFLPSYAWLLTVFTFFSGIIFWLEL